MLLFLWHKILHVYAMFRIIWHGSDLTWMSCLHRQMVTTEKTQNLRRLEAQRNELNSKGSYLDCEFKTTVWDVLMLRQFPCTWTDGLNVLPAVWMAISHFFRPTESQPAEVWDGPPMGNNIRGPSLLATYIAYVSCKPWTETDHHGDREERAAKEPRIWQRHCRQCSMRVQCVWSKQSASAATNALIEHKSFHPHYHHHFGWLRSPYSFASDC